ncbi:MAG: ATP phosphoribosyltransferase, partial [Anaerovoracaceae bacterium]
RPEELATLELRGLYEEFGYKKYKMSKFEEYSLYAANKDFLAGDKVLTFTDLDGRLMALKPDVTMSIIKNVERDQAALQKFYYIENVYRESKNSNTFKEIPQVGLEYIGKIEDKGITEVVALASETLKIVNGNYILELSHMSFVEELLKNMELSEEVHVHLLNLIRNKNRDGIKKVGQKAGIRERNIDALCKVTTLYGGFDKTISGARALVINDVMEEALDQLERIYQGLVALEAEENVQLDLSMVNDIDYYNGIIFNGYLKGNPGSVLAGGQYDRAMKKFGKSMGALGFALYLNEVAKIEDGAPTKEEGMLTIALPKGRLGDQVYGLLSQAGYECPSYNDKNRKLVIENKEKNVRYLLVKPSDVAVYVEHHAADIGIVGKDILLETCPDVYELKDLDIGKCRMAVAALKGYRDDEEKTLRVATKYVNVAKKFYQERNRDIEIIKLNGSIELGPIIGLTDVIVDIVETGSTIKENSLEVIEEFKQVSARLIANKSSYKFKNETINDIVNALGGKNLE